MNDLKSQFLSRYSNPPEDPSKLEDFRIDMENMVGTRYLGDELRSTLFCRARVLAVDKSTAEWVAQYERLIDLLGLRTVKSLTADRRSIFLKELGDLLTRWQVELGAHHGLVEVCPRNGTDFPITMRVTDEHQIVVTED